MFTVQYNRKSRGTHHDRYFVFCNYSQTLKYNNMCVLERSIVYFLRTVVSCWFIFIRLIIISLILNYFKIIHQNSLYIESTFEIYIFFLRSKTQNWFTSLTQWFRFNIIDAHWNSVARSRITLYLHGYIKWSYHKIFIKCKLYICKFVHYIQII